MSEYWKDRFPNFTEKEVSCPCCDVNGVNLESLDKLQALRTDMNQPLTINSAYRCRKHNIEEGGRPNSMHLRGEAFDISIKGLNKDKLEYAARGVGFTGFGYYNTFLHVDTGRRRFWGSW